MARTVPRSLLWLSGQLVQAALHAISWGLQRLGVVLVATVVAAILTYATLIFVIVVAQAAQSFGH